MRSDDTGLSPDTDDSSAHDSLQEPKIKVEVDSDPPIADIDDSSTHDCLQEPIKIEVEVKVEDSGLPIDSDYYTFPGDPLRMDSTDTNSEDFGATTDTKESLISRCINCGADVRNRRKHGLNLIEVQSVIRRWIAPQTVDERNVICHSCWSLALHACHVQDTNMEPSASSHQSYHRQLCVNCGVSIMRKRSHILRTDSERESLIRNTIMEWIKPLQLRGTDQICHPCWQRSNRAASRQTEPPCPCPGQATINLPNLMRAGGSQARCFFPECSSDERLLVPKWLRIKLFADFKYYVPTGCRICSYHLQNDNWAQLSSIQEPIHSFTATQIEDFATFICE